MCLTATAARMLLKSVITTVGRDGERLHCIFLYGPGMKKYQEILITDYCENNTIC